ncbi:hypothetical protein QAD02_021443 [Eretmocerus hayati]|uniref:Uncharacterized protein n=1 Tax=Eretmocerus hayati TaxID=131215 RepID=A0ACC2PV30_9HYME|nr:hypothetical protein QAD02_021443 [Eretmocerus hayati]
MIESFPDLLETDKMCAPCRELSHKQNNTPSACSTSITETVSSNDDSIPHPHDEDLLSSLVEYLEAEDDEEIERRSHAESSLEQVSSSRIDNLEDILKSLKEKFSSLPKNSPLRLSILIVASEH